MGLPFEPEPLESLRARYSEAVKGITNPKVVERNPSRAPSKKRKHVFDFEDGLRLVVSVDQYQGVRVTHYSASMYPDNPHDVMDFIRLVLDHINEVRPEPMMGQVVSKIAGRGIVHIFYDETKDIPLEPIGNPRWN